MCPWAPLLARGHCGHVKGVVGLFEHSCRSSSTTRSSTGARTPARNTKARARAREASARNTLLFGQGSPYAGRARGREWCCHPQPERAMKARPTQSKARVGSRRDRPRRPTPRRQVAAPPRKGAASVNGVCCQYSLRKDHGGGGGGASACRCRCPLARDIGMGLWRADPMAETGRSGRGP